MKSTLKKSPTRPNLDRKQAQMLEQIKSCASSGLRVFKQAYTGKSLRAAINAHCLECCWFDRQAIRECTATQCGLWAVRPYQAKGGGQ